MLIASLNSLSFKVKSTSLTGMIVSQLDAPFSAGRSAALLVCSGRAFFTSSMSSLRHAFLTVRLHSCSILVARVWELVRILVRILVLCEAATLFNELKAFEASHTAHSIRIIGFKYAVHGVNGCLAATCRACAHLKWTTGINDILLCHFRVTLSDYSPDHFSNTNRPHFAISFI